MVGLHWIKIHWIKIISLSSSGSLWEVAESLISIVYVSREKRHEGVGERISFRID